MAPKLGSKNPAKHSYRLIFADNPQPLWWESASAREAVITYRLAFPEAAPIIGVLSIGLLPVAGNRWQDKFFVSPTSTERLAVKKLHVRKREAKINVIVEKIRAPALKLGFDPSLWPALHQIIFDTINKEI